MSEYRVYATANADEYVGGEQNVKIRQELTLAGLQDMIGSIIEGMPLASSFVFTVVRVTHTKEQEDVSS